MSKPFAIVTGASSGIGLELAAMCAEEGFDLLVAADRPEIQAAANRFRGLGAEVRRSRSGIAGRAAVANDPRALKASRSRRVADDILTYAPLLSRSSSYGAE